MSILDKDEDGVFEWYGFPNRTLCDALQDMRALLKHPNRVDATDQYNALKGLVEEVQCYAHRMEASMEDQEERSKLIKELKALKKEKRKHRKSK